MQEPTDSGPSHLIGTWRTTGEGLAIEGREIPVAQFDQLRDSLAKVQQLDFSILFRAVEHNKRGFEGLVTALDGRRRMPPSKRALTPGPPQMQTRYLVLLANFLSSVRAYFDGTAHQLSHQHGKGSSSVDNFRTARAAAYDRSAAFRLMEQLRNVVQHTGSLPLDIKSMSNDEQSARRRLIADREKLLGSSVQWKTVVRKDLTKGPAYRDVADDVDEYFDSIVEIERERIKHASRLCLPHMDLLATAIESLDLNPNLPTVLVKITRDSEHALAWGWSSEAHRRNIELIKAGSAHVPGTQPTPSAATEPSGVTAEAHLVMTSWVLGGPSATTHAINSMAQDPAALRKLVTGLVNLSGVALHQVEAVLGHSVQSTLDSLVEDGDEDV